MDPLVIAAAALFGLLVGSFLNVVDARLGHLDPAARESLGGRSRCRACAATITWYDNVPVLSWLVLRARCRRCGERISARYPLVEIVTAALWAAVAADAEGVPELVTGCVLMSLLVPVTLIDFRLRIIPVQLTRATFVLGVACSLGFGPRPRFVAQDLWWLEVLVASVLAAGFLLVPNILTRGAGMGMGDVKLMAGLGAFLGAPVAVGLFAGFVLGLVPSLFIMVTKGVRAGRRTHIAFGPFLALGGALAWFVGPELLDAYLATLGA